MNPVAGNEGEFAFTSTSDARKVFVVGGGPAGMAAARTAALRGHDVTLFEKSDCLGGLPHSASTAPHKEDMGKLLAWMIRQVRNAGVHVRLGDMADGPLVEQSHPDAVIVASGGIPVVPDVEGVNRANVVGAVDVLLSRKDTGDRVAVIGGGMVGIETAEFLAARRKSVIIIARREDIGSDLGYANRQGTMQRLWEQGIRIAQNAEVKKITDDGVVVAKNGEEIVVAADTVVVAKGFGPNNDLAAVLEGKIQHLYTIGDCVQPRMLVDAIAEGSTVGRLL